MMGLGGMELVILFGLLSGGSDLEIAAVIPPPEYFKVRGIEAKVDRLVELAGQAPDTPKKQIEQLLALRHLAASGDELKKSARAAEHRQKLQEISQGKRGADPTGFAAEHARLALAAWDGARAMAVLSRSWREGLVGMPEKATLAGVVDLRTPRASEGRLPNLAPILGLVSGDFKEQLFAGVEKIGNVRIERLAFGFVEGPADGTHELVVRITGKANPDWIAELFAQRYRSELRNGPGGQSIRVVTSTTPGPAVALVGTTDFIVAAALPAGSMKEDPAKHLAVLNRFLDDLGRSTPGPVNGALKDRLAKVPGDAGAFLIGQVPAAMRSAPMPMPEQIAIHVQRTAGGLDFQFKGAMGNEVKANGLVRTISQGRDAGLKELAKLQGKALPVPGLNLNSIVNLLESIQLQANGADVELRMLVPEDAILAIPAFTFMATRVGPGN